ncbi:MAG: TrkH family potassium uptake protein [bacterium]
MLGNSFSSLHFAVRPRVVSRILGQVLVALALLTVVPALVSLLDGQGRIALRYGLVITVLGGVGWPCARARCSEELQANEAMVVSVLAFLLAGAAMAYPLAGYGLDPMDAFFEALSGVTTTGLSTLESVEPHPRAFLFGRAWLQWVGGLGVVVLALAFMIPSGTAARRLGFDDREASDYVGSTRNHARRLLLTYGALTLVGIVLGIAVGMDGFTALAHSLSAVSTGGFSTSDTSLAELSWAQRSVTILLCLAGAVSFSAYYRPSTRRLLRDARLWSLLVLVALGGLALGGVIEATGSHSGWSAWGQAAWMAASAQTTAGFSTMPTAELPASGKVLLIGGMIVGGDVGSTAGGLKVVRVLIVAQLVLVRVLRASMPRGTQLVPRIDRARVPSAEIEGVAALALAMSGVIFVSWLAFLLYDHDPLDALFEVVSAVGTVGLSSGLTGPELQPLLKAVLCLDMLMGRVELFAFFVLVFPGTWLGRRRSWREE